MENKEILQSVEKEGSHNIETHAKSLKVKKLLPVIIIAVIALVGCFVFSNGGKTKLELYKVELEAYGEYLNGDISEMGKCSLVVDGPDTVVLKINGKKYTGKKTFLKHTENIEQVYDVEWDSAPNIVSGFDTDKHTLMVYKAVSTDGGKTYDTTCVTVFALNGELKGTDVEMSAWYYWSNY